MFTYAKIALILLQIARSFLEKAKAEEIEDKGFQRAVAEVNAATLKVVGISAQTFGEVAGWTDQQVEDVLTRPPSPSQP